MAYTKPQQRKQEKGGMLRGERNQIKFIDLGFEYTLTIPCNALTVFTKEAQSSFCHFASSVRTVCLHIKQKSFLVPQTSHKINHNLTFFALTPFSLFSSLYSIKNRFCYFVNFYLRENAAAASHISTASLEK